MQLAVLAREVSRSQYYFRPTKNLECTLTNTLNTVSVVFTGYHYPTLADLLTQVTAVESSVTDLQVAMCELYEEKEEN